MVRQKHLKPKKRHHIFEYLKRYVLIIIIILSMVISNMIWQIKPTQVLETVIVDKTVPFDTYREHFGLIWILKYLKYGKSDYSFYNASYDYIGYYPDQRNNPRLLTEYDVENKDLLYLTDTYGVYTLDLVSEDKSAALDWSKEIFGGIEKSELDAIKKFIKENRMLIGEYNFFASPTELDVREELEEIIHVDWTGWTGRYFRELSNREEIPKWLPRLYEKQYLKKYDFEGPGIAFAHEDLRVVILEEEKEFNEYVYLSNIPGASDIINEKPVTAPFFYWFDIVELKENATLLAKYNIKLTKEGRKKLLNFNIPDEFPGVIKFKGDYTSYYFAGDFADTPIQGHITSSFQGVPTLMNLITFFDNSHSQHRFFWNIYFPMMRNILLEAHEMRKERGTL